MPPYDSERLPPFFRVDVRFEKRWPLGAHGHLAFVIEALNATLQKESTDVACTPSGRPGQLDACAPQSVGPISVPSIGIEGSTD